MKRTVCIALLAVACAGWGPGLFPRALGEENDAAAASEAEYQRALALVEKLGDSSFVIREAASQQLSRMGLGALRALEDGTANPNPEIRARSRRALEVAREIDRQRRIAAFAADLHGDADYGLSGWERFRTTVGSGAEARGLFVEMQRAEGKLIDLSVTSPKGIAEILTNRYMQMQQELSLLQQAPSVASIAALVFISTDDEVVRPPQISSLIYSFCNHVTIRDALTVGSSRDMLRKLLGNWVGRGDGDYYSVILATQYELKEGLVPAEKILEAGGNPNYKQTAMMAIARLGTEEHVPILEKLLGDANVLSKRKVNNDTTYESQVRDFALAALLQLTKQDPQDYGFATMPGMQLNNQTIFTYGMMGFENDAKREAAIAKWRAFWQERQKKNAAG